MNSPNNNSLMSRVIISSKTNNGRPIIDDDDDDQESGWTLYFDDLRNHHHERTCLSSSSYLVLETSLISDAAHYDNKLVSGADGEENTYDHLLHQHHRTLSFKRKRKANRDRVAAVVDNDELEDTASSPAHSPKQKPGAGSSSSSSSSSAHNSRINGRDENGETELKRRGLCLVPLSIVADFMN